MPAQQQALNVVCNKTLSRMETLNLNKKKLKLLKTLFWCLFWVLILVLLTWFIGKNIIKFSKGYKPENIGNSIWAYKFWFAGHITAGMIVLLTGPFQFNTWFRTNYLQSHRIIGYVYIFSSAIASIFLLVLLPNSLCIACRPSQSFVGVLWFVFIFIAWWTIRQKNIKAHKQFMARSYALALYFVLARLIDNIGLEKLFPNTTNESIRYANSDWLAWLIPLMLVEAYHVWLPLLKSYRR